MSKGFSKKWNETDRVLLNVKPSDVFLHCNTDQKGNPLFHSRALQGQEIVAVVGEIEKQMPLPLQGREVWTVLVNKLGTPTSLTTANCNKAITLIIPTV